VSRPGAYPAALVVALMLAAPFLGRADAQERYDLEPYQMVRSLQLVQDRIAGGDEDSGRVDLKGR
jgi:hypothetical protein